MAIIQKENSLIYIFKTEAATFSMQRIFAPIIPIPKDLFSTESTYTNTGYIIACQTSKLAFLISKKGNLVEWVKYD